MKRNPKGRLELTWMGKDMALIPVEDGKYDYAWVDPTDPRALEVKPIEVLEQVGEVEGPTGANENLLIVGDSGDALRSLGTIPEYADRYLGQAKLVYIDPPFNTEQTFEHYADQLEHSIWLTMMLEGGDLANEALKRWLRGGGQPSELLLLARSFPRVQSVLRKTLEILL